MQRPKIVVLDGYAGNPGDLSWSDMEALGDLTVYERTLPEQTFERIREADVVMTNKVRLDATMLSRLPRLRFVNVLATGVNVIDLPAAQRLGIVVSNVPAYSSQAVAQMAMGHLLNATTHVDHYVRQVRRGQWHGSPDYPCDRPIVELAGKQLGIVGLGHIGSALMHMALGMQMKVLAATSKSQQSLPDGVVRTDLDALFREADFVSLHCPLCADTQGMVSRERLLSMKKGAILVNTSRGGLVDEAALIEVLESGHLGAACLDAIIEEPPCATNPLLQAPRCYVTPHIGWTSYEARKRLMDTSVGNLKAFLEGKPTNVVS
ncbi:MAG: D-2-hydroxyacid dehydrogenase [Alloprevotella sp.]|nr:D-2-hydroxyacid dehydrogenase [Alloprevotella sp.]